MKRILFLAFVFGFIVPIRAQTVTALEYFIDTDPGVGSGTAVPVTAGSSISHEFNVSLAAVSDGFHTLSVRAKDSNNKWSLAFTSPFYKMPASAFAAAANITKLEYFIDGDLGAGGGTDVPVTASTSINGQIISVPMTAVSDGFHTISFRTRDANGFWSTAFTSPFYKIPAATFAAAPNITKMEYFIDADLGAGNGTDVPITAGTSLSSQVVNVPMTSVSDGFHTLSFRTQDANGKWSICFTSSFYKIPASSLAAASNLSKLEYFIDTDPGAGAGTEITLPTSTSISDYMFDVDVSAQAVGTHTINVRAIDANGNWSIVQVASFGVLGPEPTSQPTNLQLTAVTKNSLTWSFTASNPAPAGYLVIRKNGSIASTFVPVDGTTYTTASTISDGQIISVGTAITGNQTSLSSNTQYFYTVYAYNGSGALTNYKTTGPLVNNVTTLPDPVQITTTSFPSTYENGIALTVSVTVNSTTNVNSVSLKYRGLSDALSDLQSKTVTNIGNKYETTITSPDKIGMTYYFEITDKQSAITTSNTGKSFVHFSSAEAIPDLIFGAEVSKYQIISIPLDLTNKSVDVVFDELAPYDDTKWRLFEFDNDDFVEHPSQINHGKGYWFIARSSTTISPGAGTTVPLDANNNYILPLKPGWNLIGNPFNFKISWTEAVAASGNPTNVDDAIQTFSSGTLSDNDVLDRFRGGYVENRNTSTVNIKIPALRNKTLNGGRMATASMNIDKDTWGLKISIGDSELTNALGGIGMNPDARLDKDTWDKSGVPFPSGLAMAELNFSHPERSSLFTRDIVPFQENFTWTFMVNHLSMDMLTLSWREQIEGSKELYLLNIETGESVDMKRTNNLTVAAGSKDFKVIYGNKNYINSQLVELLPSVGTPYPNPSAKEVYFPLRIKNVEDHVSIRVYNAVGSEVTVFTDGMFSRGNYIINSNPELPVGLYWVKVKIGQELRILKLVRE